MAALQTRGFEAVWWDKRRYLKKICMFTFFCSNYSMFELHSFYCVFKVGSYTELDLKTCLNQSGTTGATPLLSRLLLWSERPPWSCLMFSTHFKCLTENNKWRPADQSKQTKIRPEPNMSYTGERGKTINFALDQSFLFDFYCFFIVHQSALTPHLTKRKKIWTIFIIQYKTKTFFLFNPLHLTNRPQTVLQV